MEEKINEMAYGPREKLEEKGIRALSDKDLVMILIGKGSAGHRVDEVAENVLKVLDRNDECPINALKFIPGMGQAKACTVLAALELGRRRPSKRGKVLRTPKEIWNEVKHYAERNQEQLMVLSFNGAGELLDAHVATVGLVDRVVMHPREIFSEAIKDRAVAVVIVHNHPSGILTPSAADRSLTAKITKAGKLLGIKVLDHLIISPQSYYSFREMGDSLETGENIDDD